MSGARIEQADIDRAFERLVGLSQKLGVDTSEWQLCEGDADTAPRQPWAICDEARPVITLGYTRRAALSAMLSQTGILAVILGA